MKAWIIVGSVAAAIVVLVIALRRPHVERQAARGQVEQLERRLKQQVDSTTINASSLETAPQEWPLTDTAKVMKNAVRDTWFVISDETDTMIQFPFPPEVTGEASWRSDAASDEDAVTSTAGYVGARACAECHRQRYEGFIHTGHHHASGLASPATVPGPFDPPRNRLTCDDPHLHFTMNNRDGVLSQTVSFMDWQTEIPMEIVTGSAKTGQSFLYWVDDGLFQAHVSYLASSDEWAFSPGMSRTPANFSRQIGAVCVECHFTYIQQKRPRNHYHRRTAVLGISCERCHGPGQEHIDYHHQHPDETSAHAIVHPASLSRQRQLDICGQCHAGDFELLQPGFSFRPGQDLSHYHRSVGETVEHGGDIHTSNQLERLRESECFQQSEMTCTTCHNPHVNQRDQPAVFVQSCLQCHQRQHCGMSDQLTAATANHCIDCHMPLSQNLDIQMQGARGVFTMPMVDHFIRIDQPATERVMEEE